MSASREIGWCRFGTESLLAVAMLAAASLSLPGAAARAASIDPELVGTWSGESITDHKGIQRWVIDRRPDGSYEARRFAITPTREVQDQSESGQWWVEGGILYLGTSKDTGVRGAWRYSTHDAACMRMQAVGPLDGKPLKPVESFGECKPAPTRSVPDVLVGRCVLDEPELQLTGSLNLRIALEPDGKRYATTDGDRDSTPVEVRDYPVLAGFSPRRPDTMTNAGEVVLGSIAQLVSDPRLQVGKRLPFALQDVRSVRLYVLQPPRPQRPMEYFGGGRAVLAEAFDRDDRAIGMVLHAMPIVAVCSAGETGGAATQQGSSAGAGRDAAVSIQGEVVEEGVYQLHGRGFAGTAPDTATGSVSTSDSASLLARERSLRAVQGVTFGFRYRLSGLGEDPLDGFEMRTLHPPMAQPGGRTMTESRYEFTVTPSGGVYDGRLTYTLEEPFEVLPGRWTLQVLYRGEVLLSREFELR